VETLVTNPFNFLVTDELALRLPAKYGAERLQVLAPYLFRPAPDKAVENLANDLLRESDGNTLNFLYNAADFLSREIRYVIRSQGDPLAPPKTLQRKEGACRDTAVLFMDVCRSLGLAARFVSGYKYDPGAADSKELHAWAEVYLPGAGWRGYDPSSGLAVADHHIVLAVGPSAQDAAPVSGNFRGTGVLSRLQYDLEIRLLEPAPASPSG
jgi:transglutaminase-like putative cysteine protease